MTIGRTHNLPAQPLHPAQRIRCATTELAHTLGQLTRATETWPTRGLAGAVGTNGDLHALGLDSDAIDQINREVFGDKHLPCDAQNYPRVWDLPVLTAVLGIVAPIADLAMTLRLMAGHGLVAETRTPGQVGSSAMPHKTNPILAERIHGLQITARGFHSMITQTCGERWNEGDISDSCTRRIAIPGLFGAVSGAVQTAAGMLARLTPDWGVFDQQLRDNLPQAITGRLLALAVTRGTNCNTAHAAIAQCYHPEINPGVFAATVGTRDDLPLTSEDVLRETEQLLDWRP
jgi:adenylosuccinate lyase